MSLACWRSAAWHSSDLRVVRFLTPRSRESTDKRGTISRESRQTCLFLAIIHGRQRLVWREIGPWRLAIGAGLFLAAVLLHCYTLAGCRAQEFDPGHHAAS